MKKFIPFVTALWFSFNISAQHEEFTLYPNGLIYSEATMKKLSGIVDSLNLKFRSCDLHKVFYSIPQTIGHLITLDTGDVKAAKQDLEKHISFDAFCKKYPEAKVEPNILILKKKYRDYKNREIIRIEHFDWGSNYGFAVSSEDLSLYQKDLKNQWLYEYQERSEYFPENLKAYFFPENFNTTELSRKYARMIGYSDCLIDTATTKFKSEVTGGWIMLPDSWQLLPLHEKKALLEEMRSIRVIGYCSQDTRPRQHAVNLAVLSAETANWEVFLKSHLDVMNDRVERAVDASYAWGPRNTYIRELEELNINVVDLLAGISFRMVNPAQNHYYGNIGRLGRALSETKFNQEVEETILSIIADQSLDYYNRLLFYFLFKSYIHYLDDEDLQHEKKQVLASAQKAFPYFFAKRMKE